VFEPSLVVRQSTARAPSALARRRGRTQVGATA
jgi:hypothetical protein